jgi:proline iminopeptidase
MYSIQRGLLGIALLLSLVGLTGLMAIEYVLLALLTHHQPLMVGLAGTTCAGLSLQLSRWFERRLNVKHRWGFRSGVMLGAIAVFTVLLLIPRSIPPAPVPSQVKFWDLSNGSHLAYIHLAAAQPSQHPPILFLHGGPGLSLSLEKDLNFFSLFAQAGYEVYKYDQIGSGYSAKLPDVRHYTIDRQVQDLELIRQKLGVKQMILWGQSWGGSLAQNYLAQHPDAVTQVILTSSGALWWDWQPDRINFQVLLDSRLSLRERLGYAIVPYDPLAAAQIITQTEGGYAWTVATDGLDFLRSINYCPDAVPLRQPINLLEYSDRVNIIVNRLITASVTHSLSPRDKLQGNSTPILYIRGACDFPLNDATKQDYVKLFPKIQFFEIPNAAHKLWNAPNTEKVPAMILEFLEKGSPERF